MSVFFWGTHALFCVVSLCVLFLCGETDSSFVGKDDSNSGDIERILASLRIKSSFTSRLGDMAQGSIHKRDANDFGQKAIDPDLIRKARKVMLESRRLRTQDISLPFGDEPDFKKDVVQLITSQGFPVQTFTVTTKDGFLLTLHRIPYGRNDSSRTSAHLSSLHCCNESTTRPSVFLQHGLLSSSADWVMNFAYDSLAMVLADAGYDVWLGNSRGNTYSKRHVKYTPKDDAFWDWTFDEMAKYDVPAFIDFILDKTGESSLYYIGHSQGTIMAFASFSSNPEYQKKIRLFVGLAPIISLNSIVSPIKYLSLLTDEELFFLFGRKSFLTNSFLIKYFAQDICDKSITNWVCSDIVFLLCGFDTENLNKTRLPVYMSHTPAGTSVKNMIHFAQFVRSKKFSMFDYGDPSDNRKHYNQPTPPRYNASGFNVPSLLFTAPNDWLADPEDVKVLMATLPNIVGKYSIPEWNHLDFVWGMNARGKCYNSILNWLPKY